ncbi:hypothetical protein HN371_13450 [Candidatus Poribacteria bacterium]|jgi:hypothetical protein|nr:hypothetical protein [Candidatus Poribacteria bacterium]MBT5531979.1 hypothetical protein [Candidatus Poribacteria bacterium]MBT5710724.1 hypothetical protein [Candidatus Poribacteria bacterium]MBT7097031.1 hypothetical protein [Candidatus Poribacteria bacterium]MBT7809270.1 hypothetical protein [Candidatus Poribacteria bacterium]
MRKSSTDELSRLERFLRVERYAVGRQGGDAPNPGAFGASRAVGPGRTRPPGGLRRPRSLGARVWRPGDGAD